MVGVRDSNLAADLGGEGAGVGVGEVALAVEDRCPLRRDRVLKVGHIDLRAGVETLDERRSRDQADEFGTAVDEVAWGRGDVPVVGPDVGGFGVVRRALAGTVTSSGGLVAAEPFGSGGADALVESDQEAKTSSVSTSEAKG